MACLQFSKEKGHTTPPDWGYGGPQLGINLARPVDAGDWTSLSSSGSMPPGIGLGSGFQMTASSGGILPGSHLNPGCASLH